MAGPKSRQQALVEEFERIVTGREPPTTGETPILRAPSRREALADWLSGVRESVMGSVAEQPAVRILAGLPGEAAEYLGLNPRPEVAEYVSMGAMTRPQRAALREALKGLSPTGRKIAKEAGAEAGTIVGGYPISKKTSKVKPQVVTAYREQSEAAKAKGLAPQVDPEGQVRKATKRAEGRTQFDPDPAVREAGRESHIYTIDPDWPTEAGPGMTRQRPVGDWRGFIEGEEFANRMDEMAARGREYLASKEGQDWWGLEGSDIERIYGKDRMEAFAGYLASTANRTPTDRNLMLASEYMRRDITGEPVVQPEFRIGDKGGPPTSYTAGKQMQLESNRAKNLEKVRAGRLDELQAEKISSEARALTGDPTAMVFDTHQAKLAEDPARGIYLGDEFGRVPSQQYKIMEDVFGKQAAKHQMTPREFTAYVWTGIREKIRKTGELYGQIHAPSTVPGESVGYSTMFMDIVRKKADALGVPVEVLEQRLASGDANLLKVLLSTGAGTQIAEQVLSDNEAPD